MILVLSLSFINKASAGIDTTLKIAILPFTVFIDTTNLPSDINEAGVLRRSDMNRYRFQRALHTWFIKKKGKYALLFQDVVTTNLLLKQAGLTDSINTYTINKLCSILGVDAVIFGNVYVTHQRETVGREVMRQVVGIDVGPNSKILINLNLYNSSGNIGWSKKYNDYRATITPDAIIDRFLRKEYKTFPYKK